MKTVSVLVGVLAIASTSAFGQAPFLTDHFKCYVPTAVDPKPPAPVLLLDQFGTSNTVVQNVVRLCNPAKKRHNGVITPIMNPDDHLTIFRTGPQPLVTRQVNIQNQFGQQVLITQDARFLGVPTQKDPHGPPRFLNHFSCYAVANGPVLNIPIGLSDQFFPSNHNVLRAAYFCNPVQKTHNGVVTPITNPNDHLTCYTMTKVPFDRTVTLHNQFGNPKFESKLADFVCVPTQKLSWHVMN